MSITTRTPPANFIRLDTTINATGSWANARDLTVLRENHNKLLCERTKHTIFSSVIGSSHSSFSTPHGLAGNGTGQQDVLAQFPVRVSDGTMRLRVCIYGALVSGSTGGTDDVAIFPDLLLPGEQPRIRNISDSTTRILINSTSNAMWECDCIVRQAAPLPDVMTLSLLVSGGWRGSTLDSAKGSADNFEQVGDDWCVVDNDQIGYPIGSVLVDQTTTSNQPRVIVDVFSHPTTGGSGTGELFYVSPPWANRPSVGNVAGYRNARGVTLQSITVYEKDRTEFNEAIDY